MNQKSLSPEMQQMRDMINKTRNDFQITLSELLVGLDEFGMHVSQAIGDVSYDEALQGLVTYLQREVNLRKQNK